MNIVFLGNHQVSHSTESHHCLTLESMGHQVIRLQEGEADVVQIMAASKDADLVVWTHTHGWGTEGDLNELSFLPCPIISYHLDLWLGLERQKDLDTDHFWRHIDHFFTVDRLMADYLNANTGITAHYLTAGVYDKECYISTEPSEYANDIVFVGSKSYHPEWPYRPNLIDWLHYTYEDRFTHIGGGSRTCEALRGDDLNRLYANSKIVVGDSLCLNFDYPDYWSDRIYETMGRGGFLIHPGVPGIARQFTAGVDLSLYPYGDYPALKEKIDFYLGADSLRDRIRMHGHERVKNHHTYVQRWTTILETLDCHQR